MGASDVVMVEREGATAGEVAPADATTAEAGGADRAIAWLHALRPGRALSWVLGAPVVLLGAGAWAHRWVAEDAFITFRVVDMTLAGHPLVFNADERVEAATSPLWLWVLIALRATAGRFVDLAWLALLAGLALALAGLAAGVAASVMSARAAGHRGALWPAGALALAALAPMWDFATSGLETGLLFGWLGGSHWLLTRRWLAATGGPADRPGALRPWWLPVVLGLGPLIRPDAAVFSAVFLAVLVLASRPGWRGCAGAVAVALALPGAYQVFRMAYFASLVPGPALAKEAAAADWPRGLAYAANLVDPYRLAVPVVVLAVWFAAVSLGAARRRDRLVLAAPAVGGVVHALFVVRVGGDFMHGRLLLPGLFALALPVAALPLPPVAGGGVGRRLRPLAAVPAVLLAGWAVACVVAWRPPVSGSARWPDVADERQVWNAAAGVDHAVTLADHAAINGVARGRYARWRSEQGADVFIPYLDERDEQRVPSPIPDLYGPELPLAPGEGVVFHGALLGMSSTAAGPAVLVRDHFGLADALGARLTPVGTNRVGHQKPMPPSYLEATLPLADPGAPARLSDPAELAAARRVLDCPAVRDLRAATREPLTLGRLLRNVLAAPALTRLRIPRDPRAVTSCDQLR